MKLLIVEDDQAVLTALVEQLEDSGLKVDTALCPAVALEKVAEADLLVTDLRLPELSGLELLQEARKRKPELEVIVMTAFGTIPSAIEAMRKGARAYLTKPFDPEELLIHAREVEKLLTLRQTALRFSRGDLVGSSETMQKVYQQIDLAAGSEAPVLITGETGTGKELAAAAIHDLSSPPNRPFIAVNLGALPKDLVEAELFGHEKGAFTGANCKLRGRFLLADQGTLFLDELDSLAVELQPKLLRAIERKEIWRLGMERPEKVNVRIIAAMNANVEKLVQTGKFREDLYYRLNVHRIIMPPLREHPEDIPIIVRTLLDRFSKDRTIEESDRIGISAEALTLLLNRSWPGNVRELANTLEKACVNVKMKGRSKIGSEDFDLTSDHLPTLSFREAKEKVAEEWSIRSIMTALSISEGNVSRAARLLKINQNSLFRLIKKYKIRNSRDSFIH